MSQARNDLPAHCRDIPLPQDWQGIALVEKGWSRDLKYRVSTRSGKDYLLRLNESAPAEARRQEFVFVLRLHEAGLPVPKAHAFGQLAGACTYMVLDWVEGEDLAEVLPGLPPARQYELGLEAGRRLRAIHNTPIRPDGPQARDMKARALNKLTRFEEAGLNIPNSRAAADFAREHLHWLDAHPPVCLHGDFHPGNLVYTPQGHIAVIDFNRWDVGDPVEEFIKLQSFTIQISVPFARGQLDGYFGGPPDRAFWRSLAVHNAVTGLYSIRWARPFGAEDVAGMVARFERAYDDYQGFTRLIPAWYQE